MKLLRPAIVLIGLAAYASAFCSTPLPSLRGNQAQSPNRLGLLFAVLKNPGDALFSSWFGTPPQFAIVERVPVLAAAGLITAWAAALGWLLLAAFRVARHLTRLEAFCFSTAAGFNILSTLTLLLGLFGRLHRTWLIAAPMSLTFLAVVLVWRRRRKNDIYSLAADSRGPMARGSDFRSKVDINILGRRWLWLALPFVAAIVLAAMLPPFDFDVCEYHLQAPKEFFQQRRITFLPHNVYANMAMGTEMLSLLGMTLVGDWWLGALVGKTVIAVFTLLCTAALFAAGRRLHSTSAGVAAALVYISIPWVFSVSVTGWVEGAAACYLFLTLYALLLSPQQPVGFVALAGYMAGSAVATKYPAVLFVLLPMAAWVFFGKPWRKKPRLGDEETWRLGDTHKSSRLPVSQSPRLLVCFLCFLLAAMAACGGWFGKNWVLTGNPTYPLLYEVFGGKTWTPDKNAQWNRVHRPHDFSPATLGRDLNCVVLTSEWLSPLVVPLAALAFFGGAGAGRKTRLAWALLLYAAFVVAAWWLFTHRIDRFWVPMLPLLALLAGMGVCWNEKRWWRYCLRTILLVGLAANFLVVSNGWIWPNTWFVSLHQLRNEEPYVLSWQRYLNENCHGRILTVGDAGVFPLKPPTLYNTCFDDCIFEQLTKGKTPEAVRAQLALCRIDYVFVNWSEIERYRATYGFTSYVQPAVFEELVKHGVLKSLHKEDAGELYGVDGAD
jgi:hypothetical protein